MIPTVDPGCLLAGQQVGSDSRGTDQSEDPQEPRSPAPPAEPGGDFFCLPGRVLELEGVAIGGTERASPLLPVRTNVYFTLSSSALLTSLQGVLTRSRRKASASWTPISNPCHSIAGRFSYDKRNW